MHPAVEFGAMNSITLAAKTPFYIVKSGFTILKSPGLASLCMIPGVSGLAAAFAGMICAFIYRSDLSNLLISNQNAWYFSVVGFAVFLLGCLISAILGFVTASVAGGYFIELLAEKLLRRVNLACANSGESVVQVAVSIARAAMNETILLGGILICTILTFALSFIPFLSLAPILMGALIAGFSLYNLPLGVLEVPLRLRFKIVKEQLLPCICLGTCFSGLLLIPFASVLFLPAFYGAAIHLLADNTVLIEYQSK